MKETALATWKVLEKGYELAKKNTPDIVFNTNAYNDFYSYFKNWRNIILTNFMKDEVKELDRHKIAAILTISIIESKAIKYEGNLDGKVFLGSQLLAVSCGLSYMQDQLNKVLTFNFYKTIEKYIMPTPFSCPTNYFEVIARNLYYEENGVDLNGQKLWHLNPLQLANTYFLLELYTLEQLKIPTDILRE